MAKSRDFRVSRKGLQSCWDQVLKYTGTLDADGKLTTYDLICDSESGDARLMQWKQKPNTEGLRKMGVKTHKLYDTLDHSEFTNQYTEIK